MARPRKLITARGRTQDLETWARELGVTVSTLRKRLDGGMSHEDAMCTPRDRGRPGGKELYPGARALPWAEDWRARLIVAEMGGLTLNSIASVMGCSKERVRQIEQEAIVKLRSELGSEGRELLRALDEARSEREARLRDVPGSWGLRLKRAG